MAPIPSQTTKKRLAIFQVDLGFGGIQKSLLNLLHGLDPERYEMDLYLTQREENPFLDRVPETVTVRYLKPLPYWTRLVRFSLLERLYRPQVTQGYDVAMDFNSYSMDTALAAAACQAPVKAIWVHNDMVIKRKEEPKYRVLHHFFGSKYRRFTDVVAVSQGAMNAFVRLHGNVTARRHVIPNLIDTEEILRLSQAPSDIQPDASQYNWCSVGRMVHQKGFDLLLPAFQEAAAKRSDLHLYLIGDGPERPALERQTAELGLADRVTFCGFAENPYALMRQMDGLVLTSRYEGQGMVFLEGKALGLDIVLPPHLEAYVEGIPGTEDVASALASARKKVKQPDGLAGYNQSILTRMDDLLCNQ